MLQTHGDFSQIERSSTMLASCTVCALPQDIIQPQIQIEHEEQKPQNIKSQAPNTQWLSSLVRRMRMKPSLQSVELGVWSLFQRNLGFWIALDLLLSLLSLMPGCSSKAEHHLWIGARFLQNLDCPSSSGMLSFTLAMRHSLHATPPEPMTLRTWSSKLPASSS